MQLMKMTKLGRNRFVIDFHFKKTNTDILLAFSIIIKNRWETPRKLLDLKWPIFYETFISIGFVKHTYDSIKETDDSDAFWTTLLSVNKFSVKTFSRDDWCFIPKFRQGGFFGKWVVHDVINPHFLFSLRSFLKIEGPH